MKVGSHHCSIFTYLHYRTVRIFSTIKIIDECHFQFSFYAWKFSSYCSAEMFAIFVRLEKAKVGTRFRGYPPTKLLFFIMTRSDNLLGLLHQSVVFHLWICEFVHLYFAKSTFKFYQPQSTSDLTIRRNHFWRNMYSFSRIHVPTAVSRDMYETFIS